MAVSPLEAKAHFDLAAAKTYDRLRADAARTSHRISPLVVCIEQHVFEPDFNYERLRALCGVRDNNRTTMFRAELGLTPHRYIRECRMEVACRLLRDTSLDTATIGGLVGYGGPQIFTAAFKRYANMPPTRYRRLAPRRQPTTSEVRPPRWLPDPQPSTWRRFVLGALEGEEVSLFFRHFLATYPEIRRRLALDVIDRLVAGRRARAGEPGLLDRETRGEVDSLLEGSDLLTREHLEWLLAGLVWRDLSRLSRAEQVERVRRGVAFETPAFFRFLGEESLRVAAADPGAALHLARLALEHTTRHQPGDEEDGTHPMQAIAWAWIANAKREAGDLEGAARAFEAAEHRLPSRELASSAHEEVGSLRALLGV